jgi:hypothetical protein
MANPPITIGPFANVPAPGSPIKSDWPQQVSQFVYDKRIGNLAVVTGGTDQIISASTYVDVTGATLTFTAVAGRRYRYAFDCNLYPQVYTAGMQAEVSITNPGGGLIVHRSVTIPANLSTVAFRVEWVETPGAGSITRKVQASVTGGQLAILGSSSRNWQFTVEDVGL